MTKIIINNSMGELGATLTTTRKALILLKAMKSATTFVFQSSSLTFVESYFVVAKNDNHYNELHVFGEEAESND